jgi:hypothetical protein
LVIVKDLIEQSMEPSYDNTGGSCTTVFLPLAVLLTALFIAFPGVAVKANDTSFLGSGATVYTNKENRVRMEKEEVVIRYNHDAVGSETEKLSKWLADCTFTFVNITDKPIDVQIGFPDTQAFDEESGFDGAKPRWTIRDFKVMINGIGVPTAHKDVVSAQEIVMPKATRKLNYQGAYTWQAHFEPKERITIKNTYSFGGGSSAVAIKDLMRRKVSGPAPRNATFWGKNRPKRCEWDFGNSAYSWVDYIVTTGLTWAGPIGEADIAIEVPPYTLPHLLLPAPEGFIIRDGFVRWHFKQWQPTNEIALFTLTPMPQSDCEELYDTKPPLFDTLQQVQTWIKIARTHQVDRHTVSLIRNAYLAKYGYRFNDEKLQFFFDHQHWYIAKPGIDLKAIPQKDQQIMILLEQFENSLN